MVKQENKKTTRPDLEDFRIVMSQNLDMIERAWGRRCEVKDTDDFPELVGSQDARCPVCLVYERFDEYWKTVNPNYR